MPRPVHVPRPITPGSAQAGQIRESLMSILGGTRRGVLMAHSEKARRLVDRILEDQFLGPGAGNIVVNLTVGTDGKHKFILNHSLLGGPDVLG